MKAATFKLDVTPPVGDWLAYCQNKKVDSPIFIRGIIIDNDGERFLLASCDFIYIHGIANQEWIKALAEAAGTSEDNIFLHSVHQHDSVRINPYLNEYKDLIGRDFVSERYCADTLSALTRMVSEKISTPDSWSDVAKILTAENKLEKLASNRRLIDENGKCFAMRFSMCGNEDLRKLPEGVIDPFLRTVAFKDSDGGLIAALHFYASHPMAAYHCEMVSADVPGVALNYVAEQRGDDGLHIYFTGCGGNVTFGKYFTGDKEESLKLLGERLGKGIIGNMENLKESEFRSPRLASASFEFPFSPDVNEAALRRKIEENLENLGAVSGYVTRLHVAQNKDALKNYTVSGLSFGDNVAIMAMPGEVCVEYQIHAVKESDSTFLAVAAYGDCSYHYVPTSKMYEEGGYEPEFGAVCTSEIEHLLKGAISEVVAKMSERN